MLSLAVGGLTYPLGGLSSSHRRGACPDADQRGCGDDAGHVVGLDEAVQASHLGVE